MASKTFLDLSNHRTGWKDRNHSFLEAFKQHLFFFFVATDIKTCLCTILCSRIGWAAGWRLLPFKVAAAQMNY